MTRTLPKLLETACLLAFWPMAMVFCAIHLMIGVTLDIAGRVCDVWGRP